VRGLACKGPPAARHDWPALSAAASRPSAVPRALALSRHHTVPTCTCTCPHAAPDAPVRSHSPRSASAFTAPVSVRASSAVARSSDVALAAKKPVKKTGQPITKEGGGFIPWLMSGRPRTGIGGAAKGQPEMEFLSGLARKPAVETLNDRFKILYDTRPRKATKTVSKSSKFNPKDASSW
jgi:hypothetical protein